MIIVPLSSVLILIQLFSPSTSLAVGCFHKDLSEFGKLNQPIMEFANLKTRRATVEEYQKLHDDPTINVAGSVAATGKLTCKGSVLSANLVVKGDVILTAGPALVDPNTCKKLSDPSACSFTVTGRQPIPVANLIKSGNKCPQKGVKDSDWAILKLSRPVEGVVPSALSEPDPREGVTPKEVIAVGDHSRDFRRPDRHQLDDHAQTHPGLRNQARVLSVRTGHHRDQLRRFVRYVGRRAARK